MAESRQLKAGWRLEMNLALASVPFLTNLVEELDADTMNTVAIAICQAPDKTAQNLPLLPRLVRTNDFAGYNSHL